MLPGVLTSLKKLRTEPNATIRKILNKFIRAVLFIVFAGAGPWALICLFSRLGMLKPGRWGLISFTYIVAMSAVFVEPMGKHQQYVGYFGPKALETLATLMMEYRLFPKTLPGG